MLKRLHRKAHAFGYRWAAEGFNDPVKDQKIPKIHSLFRTKDKMHALLFYSQLLAIAIEQIHVFVYLEYKQISLSKLNQSCRQYPVYN